MRHPLDSVRGKISRAKIHLDQLETDIGRRSQLHEFGIFLEDDPQTGEQIVYAWVPYELRMSWGLMAGDVVHNLRSALDHLVCQLIRVDDPGHPCDKSEFPIYSSLSKYKDENGARKITGVRGGAEKVIEKLQPQDPDSPLWLISQLDNWDKHRLVQASVGVADLGGVGVGGTGTVQSMHITVTRAVLDDVEDGAELYRARMDRGVKVQVRPSVEIAFAQTGPGAGKPVVATLAQLIEYVETGIVPKFGLHRRKARTPRWQRPDDGSHR